MTALLQNSLESLLIFRSLYLAIELDVDSQTTPPNSSNNCSILLRWTNWGGHFIPLPLLQACTSQFLYIVRIFIRLKELLDGIALFCRIGLYHSFRNICSTFKICPIVLSYTTNHISVSWTFPRSPLSKFKKFKAGFIVQLVSYF